MADSKATQSVAKAASKSPSKPRVISPSELKKRLPSTRGPHPSSFSKSSSPIDLPDFSLPSSQERPTAWSSFLSRFRARYAALPTPVRRTARVLRTLAPIVPIGIFFSEHVLQVMWVRGPSMTPYLNENYAQMQTESDIVLVNVWPWGSTWPWNRARRLERGMVVTFQ
jgi:mitochondrial inner membrane protease subunit 2